jgi:HPt (histidine-containing phosphotransfer) domain-containing protein
MTETQPVESKLLNDKTIDGLDMHKGLERYNGNEGIYLKILRSYAESVGDMLEAIQVFNESDIENYRIKVHGIKGASYDIFAEQIGKDAEALEDAAKSVDIDFINMNNQPFFEAATRLITDIRNVLQEIKEENPKPKKEKPDGALLLKLFNACEDYKYKDAEEAMTEIEIYQYESDDGLSEWLRLNLDMMDFMEISKKLSTLLDNMPKDS